MTGATRLFLNISAVALAACLVLEAAGQDMTPHDQTVPNLPANNAPQQPLVPTVMTSSASAVEQLQSFKEASIKFNIDDLMDLLRDKRHEGWLLVAYPDPKTAQPLIGAGFSLDLPAREHPQSDPLNSNAFLEPSSADLWLASGLDPTLREKILSVYYHRLDDWNKQRFRAQMKTLDPQITDDDANALLRVGIVQAAINARAYCRYFDQLTASQQMGLTQLVYQMGVNMEEFTIFRALINRETTDATGNVTKIAPGPEYWRQVQRSLEDSRWARLYHDRATNVIAMFDPHYELHPAGAEHSVHAVLVPARRHRRGAVREAGLKRHGSSAARRRASRKRKN